jgi:hypothetical protein
MKAKIVYFRQLVDQIEFEAVAGRNRKAGPR